MQLLAKSVFFKFSLAFLLAGLIPLLSLSFYSIQTFTSHVERYTMDNLQQMVLYMSYNVNAAMKEYDEVSKLMYTGRYDGYVEGSSDNQAQKVNTLEQINSVPIEGYLKTLLYSDSYISSAYFVRKMDGKLYYASRYNTAFIQDKLPVNEWLEALNAEPRKSAFFPTHETAYFKGSNQKVMTIGRNLIDISGALTTEPKVVGTLFFDVDVSVFQQFFSELKLGSLDEIYLIDRNGEVYFSNQDVYGQTLDMQEQNDKDMLSLSEPVPYLGGNIVANISKYNLFEQLSITRFTVFLALGICSIVLVCLGVWFSRRLSAPIRRVIQQMVRVESGNLEARVAVKGNDEIGRLGHGFNRMVERLETFIEEAYVAELKQKQTELNALKSQIRPHYLYNTLEVIRMNAVHNDDPEVGDMILSLSNQLKYVIDYGEEWVTLQEELDHLKDYFYIIDVRFESRYSLKVHIAEDVSRDTAVLKLSLQPFVENAVQHGLQPQGRGTVSITATKRGDRLMIMIMDDGIGMDEPDLLRVQNMLSESGTPAGHVGMKNVHERIRSLCGEEYGVSVSSRQHIGTVITMEFPLREEHPGQ
nr:sensor histidine kinase [Paenibacillus lemnae]